MAATNDLLDFDEPAKPAQEVIEPTASEPAKPLVVKPWMVGVITLIVGFLIGVSIHSLPQWGERRDQNEDDKKQIVVPTKYEGSTLIFVSEKQKRTVNETLVMRSAKAFCDTFKLAGYRDIDEEDAPTEFTDAAKAASVQSPFVCIVLKDGKTVKVKPWPTVDSMGDLLK